MRDDGSGRRIGGGFRAGTGLSLERCRIRVEPEAELAAALRYERREPIGKRLATDGPT
jgi:hypothetical protein